MLIGLSPSTSNLSPKDFYATFDLIDVTFRINLVKLARLQMESSGPITCYEELQDLATKVIAQFSTWDKFQSHQLHVPDATDEILDIFDPAFELEAALEMLERIDDGGGDEVGGIGEVEPVPLPPLEDTYREYMNGGFFLLINLFHNVLLEWDVESALQVFCTMQPCFWPQR